MREQHQADARDTLIGHLGLSAEALQGRHFRELFDPAVLSLKLPHAEAALRDEDGTALGQTLATVDSFLR